MDFLACKEGHVSTQLLEKGDVPRYFIIFALSLNYVFYGKWMQIRPVLNQLPLLSRLDKNKSTR